MRGERDDEIGGLTTTETELSQDAKLSDGWGPPQDAGLEGVEAVIERQQRVTAESNDYVLVFGRQNR